MKYYIQVWSENRQEWITITEAIDLSMVASGDSAYRQTNDSTDDDALWRVIDEQENIIEPEKP